VTLVIDASVAVKWVLPETDADKALVLRTHDPDLIAPALVVAEIGSALWKAAARGDVSKEAALAALRLAVAHYARLEPLDALAAAAVELAIDLRHPIYDCFYIALAQREGATLVSADAKLLVAAKRVRGVEARRLGDEARR
jgi:predicted nucleic acid-binding protein